MRFELFSYFRPVLCLIVIILGTSTGTELHARVSACLLDGGNDSGQRLCNSERWANAVRSSYPSTRNASTYRENLVSGDGTNPANDCSVSPLYREGGTPEAPTLTSVRRTSARFDTEINRANSESSVNAATAANFNNCFSGARSSDVCHFWSANHGFANQAGTDVNQFGNPTSVISLYGSTGGGGTHGVGATEVRNLFNNSNCGAVKYVLNNCYSGGLHSVILNPTTGRVIPNRCGVSSTNPYDVASSVPSDIDRSRPVHHETLGVLYPPAITYNYTESFSQALHGHPRRSLDEAHFEALKNSNARELPESSIDFFLNHYFEQQANLPRDSFARSRSILEVYNSDEARCLESAFGNTFIDMPAIELMNFLRSATESDSSAGALAGVSSTDRTFIQNQLDSMSNQVRDFELFLCQEFFSEQCLGSESERREFIRLKMEQDFITPRNALGQAYRDLTDSTAPRLTDCPSGQHLFRGRCLAASIIEHCPITGPNPYTSTLNMRGCIEARMDTLNEENNFYRRYESLTQRLSHSVRFLRQASPEQVQDFITLRECETSPFSSVP